MTSSFSAGDPGKQEGPTGAQGASFSDGKDPRPKDQNPEGTGANKDTNIDVEKLIKRLNDSQEFINTLKAERQNDVTKIKELEELVSKVPKMEDILREINQGKQTSNDNLDTDTLVTRAVEGVRQALSKDEAKKVQEANFNQVSKTLTEHFGAENVDAEVTRIAAENDLTFDEVLDLAYKKPKAVFKLLGISDKKAEVGSAVSPTGTINSAALNNLPRTQSKMPNISEIRDTRGRVDATKEYFKKLGIEFGYNS